jgi:ubiquinone/menaquinone biosynthesis C-methylase UbiE
VSLSPRRLAIVDALPLEPGLRVLEIGGAPGAAAREVARRIAPHGHILVLDRSPAGITATERNCAELLDEGLLSTLCARVEHFALDDAVLPFDLAFASRVGALDGRHPRLYAAAIKNIARVVKPGGALYVDTGNPLRRIELR